MSINTAKFIFKILKAYDISVTYQTIKSTILNHPEYPSMQCLSDALDSWRIKHIVIKLTLERLKALETPVIAHLKKNEFVWVIQITDSKVYIEDSFGTEKVDSFEHFEQEWSGVALAIEDITNAGEVNYKEKKEKS